MIGCGGKQSNNDFVIIDVLKNYPKKEIMLQDFADVEYIPLESADDEFLNDGMVHFINNEFIILRNRKDRNAILIFDRHTGKALKKISRQGQGPEEYITVINIVFDEDRRELFVADGLGSRKILVYDLDGQFKRRINYPKDVRYSSLHNYDRGYLLGSNNGSTDEFGQMFHIISKEDGSVVRQIDIPFEKKANLPAITPSGYPIAGSTSGIFLYKNEFIITDLSTDTVYSCSADQDLQPFIVRTPPIHAMSYPEVYLSPRFISDRYYFMRTVKMDIAPYKTLESFLSIPLPSTDLVYDTKEKASYEYKLYNADITNKTEVDISGPCNNEIIFIESIDAYRLVEYYKKGELKGRLEEIAATLDEDDNPVIMLVKHKK